MNETQFQKMPEQHHVTQKNTAKNYVIGNQKSSRRNQIHSITLELKHVINYCDVRRGVCATSLSAKEKGLLQKTAEI